MGARNVRNTARHVVSTTAAAVDCRIIVAMPRIMARGRPESRPRGRSIGGAYPLPAPRPRIAPRPRMGNRTGCHRPRRHRQSDCRSVVPGRSTALGSCGAAVGAAAGACAPGTGRRYRAARRPSAHKPHRSLPTASPPSSQRPIGHGAAGADGETEQVATMRPMPAGVAAVVSVAWCRPGAARSPAAVFVRPVPAGRPRRPGSRAGRQGCR